MRVISGTARGRRLWVPRGGAIRPATDRLKESLFNILVTVEEETVLDLYAGTGSLAIEALSRGAAHAVLVEKTPEGIGAIECNLRSCGFQDRATVVRGGVVQALGGGRVLAHAPYHLVFCDPPYSVGNDELGAVAERLAEPGTLASGARLAYERRTGDEAPPLPDGWAWLMQRSYGQTTLHIAEPEPD